MAMTLSEYLWCVGKTRPEDMISGFEVIYLPFSVTLPTKQLHTNNLELKCGSLIQVLKPLPGGRLEIIMSLSVDAIAARTNNISLKAEIKDLLIFLPVSEV